MKSIEQWINACKACDKSECVEQGCYYVCQKNKPQSEVAR